MKLDHKKIMELSQDGFGSVEICKRLGYRNYSSVRMSGHAKWSVGALNTSRNPLLTTLVEKMKHQRILGHEWDGPMNETGTWGVPAAWMICKRCGFRWRAKGLMPEATMRFLKIPECDQYLIESVHNE